jgi:hypothetical protein
MITRHTSNKGVTTQITAQEGTCSYYGEINSVWEVSDCTTNNLHKWFAASNTIQQRPNSMKITLINKDTCKLLATQPLVLLISQAYLHVIRFPATFGLASHTKELQQFVCISYCKSLVPILLSTNYTMKTAAQ